MTDLDLHFIGTSNAFAEGGNCWNGFLVNGAYLFEAPPAALMGVNKIGANANDLEAVILSHHHGDHFLGLPFLLLHWKYMGRTRPVTIIGPSETKEVTRQVCERVYPHIEEGTPYGITWITAVPGQPVTVGDLTVESVPVKHDVELNENLGYHCRLGGRRFAYTGDSAICDSVLDLARGAEVLVSECTSIDKDLPTHMNMRDDLPRVRAALAPDSPLLLTHMGADVQTTSLPLTTIARDFERYRF